MKKFIKALLASLIGILAVGVIAGQFLHSSGKFEVGTNDALAQVVSEAKEIPADSEESARQAAIGVWTNTEPLISLVQQNFTRWNRFEFRPDGTADHFHAKPTDNDWGKPVKLRWHISSAKYIDTGKRYFSITFDDDDILLNLGLIFIDNNSLEMYCFGSITSTVVRKGDVFPFST